MAKAEVAVPGQRFGTKYRIGYRGFDCSYPTLRHDCVAPQNGVPLVVADEAKKRNYIPTLCVGCGTKQRVEVDTETASIRLSNNLLSPSKTILPGWVAEDQEILKNMAIAASAT